MAENADLPEKELQRQVRAYARLLGWEVHTTWTSIHSPRGWPDLTCWRQTPEGGELVCIELKSRRGRVSPEQEAWIARLAAVPGVRWAGVIRPADWFSGALDDVLR